MMICSMLAQCCSTTARLSRGRLAAPAGEYEAAHVVFHPEALFDGSVADPLISGDHDEVKGRDDGKPFIIERAPGDLGKLDMSRVDNVVVDLAERLAESQVVLVDEEPGRHRGLRHQRPKLFLIRDRRADQLGPDLVPVRDLLDGLAGVEQLPKPLGRDPIDGRATEANERIDHHG